jgi:phage repressor protein C with HTH and peptisase S24 domain
MEETGFGVFLDRVRQATDIKSQAELAKALGIGRAAVSLAKRKDRVPYKWIHEIAGRYGLSHGWLATGQGGGQAAPSARSRAGAGPASGAAGPEGNGEYAHVPKVVARLCAGGGSFETGGEVIGYYAFRSDWIRRKGDPGRMVLMDIMGNSMEPELRDGDTVLLDQSRQDVLAGSIYAVGVDDMVLVKRVEKRPGALVLLSDNTDYAPILVRGDELATVRIVGKVVWSSREYR